MPDPTTTTLSDQLVIGNTSHGEMHIDNGSVVESSAGIMAGGPSSTADVTVDGANSTWTNAGLLIVGVDGNATLAISNGGEVSDAIGDVGFIISNSFVFGTGNVSVTGVDSLWTNTGPGNSIIHFESTLAISDGGYVTFGDTFFLAGIGVVHPGVTVGPATLNITLGSTSDTFLDVVEAATLDGIIDIDLATGYDPNQGDVFQVLTAGSYAGTPTFNFDDAVLPMELEWDTSNLLTNGTISVSGVPIDSADFDGNGIIDGADFLKWQRGETPEMGSAEELALWESQYGSTVPAVAAAAAVPEPSSVSLLAILSATGFLLRRKGWR